jgi:hypothetical protein
MSMLKLTLLNYLNQIISINIVMFIVYSFLIFAILPMLPIFKYKNKDGAYMHMNINSVLQYFSTTTDVKKNVKNTKFMKKKIDVKKCARYVMFFYGIFVFLPYSFLQELNYLSILMVCVNSIILLVPGFIYISITKYVKYHTTNIKVYYYFSTMVWFTVQRLNKKIKPFNYLVTTNYYMFNCLLICIYTYCAMKFFLDKSALADSQGSLNLELNSMNESNSQESTMWDKWFGITVVVIGTIISWYSLYHKIYPPTLPPVTVEEVPTPPPALSPSSNTTEHGSFDTLITMLENLGPVNTENDSEVPSPSQTPSPSNSDTNEYVSFDTIMTLLEKLGPVNTENDSKVPSTNPAPVAHKKLDEDFDTIVSMVQKRDENIIAVPNNLLVEAVGNKQPVNAVTVAPQFEVIESSIIEYREDMRNAVIHNGPLSNYLFSEDRKYLTETNKLQGFYHMGKITYAEKEECLVSVRYTAYTRKFGLLDPKPKL